jgi:hypothetical protein
MVLPVSGRSYVDDVQAVTEVLRRDDDFSVPLMPASYNEMQLVCRFALKKHGHVEGHFDHFDLQIFFSPLRRQFEVINSNDEFSKSERVVSRYQTPSGQAETYTLKMQMDDKGYDKSDRLHLRLDPAQPLIFGFLLELNAGFDERTGQLRRGDFVYVPVESGKSYDLTFMSDQFYALLAHMKP